MRMLGIFSAIVALATPALAEWSTINSEDQLKKFVINKKFVDPKSKAWFSIRRNGTLTGSANKQKLTGNWKWNGKYICFNRALGGKKLPGDCILIRVDGKNLTTTRKNGTGRTTLYVRG